MSPLVKWWFRLLFLSKSVFHDIIEPKQAEEAILRANEELQQIVQEVTTERLQANQQLEREIEGES